jgi:signal transduction histidine kinase
MPHVSAFPAPLEGPLDALPDPVLVLDAAWRVRAANDAARAMLDAPAATSQPDAAGTVGEAHPALGDRPLLELLPPRQAAVVERCLHQATATGRASRLQVRDPEPGTDHVTHVTVVPRDGELTVMLHLAHGAPPVTREVDAERTLLVSQGLIEAGISLAAEQALDRLLQEVVDVARELTGARYAALGVVNDAGTGLSDFITSGLSPQQRERIGNLPTGHGILGLLVRDARPIRLADMNDHPVSVGVPANHPHMRAFMGVPVVTRGRVFGNLYLTEKQGGAEFTDADLTLARTFAAQAAVAIDNAQLRRERDRFFAAASHELGNAMAGVTLWARLLVRQPPADHESWLRGVRNILGGAEQTTRLVEDLLSLSRLREGRLTLDPRQLCPAEVGAEALELLRPESEAASVTLAMAPGATERAVISDAARVRQIVVNLLGNAIKFSPAGGRVTLAVEDDDADAVADGAADAPGGNDAAGMDGRGDGVLRVGGVLVTVRDEGPGVPAEHRERIFQPYEQIASVARGRGTGLGLHLSRQLARLMGGDLWVEDAPGGGARFALRLPPVLPARSELPYDKR